MQLAELGREYLLAGHLIDRAGMPHVIAEFGRDAMEAVAIDEWMGASPVYTRRVKRALGIEGNGVSAIFKAMQFDIGAPHEFMDFRYSVADDAHGEFHLASCGALLDVEPLGDEFVTAMCHHIEDPTFDATAAATNPRAQVRPVHRPPRTPADRHPHCRWKVDIVPDAEPVAEPAAAAWLAGSRGASVTLPTRADSSYGGPLDPDLRLEQLSDRMLRCAMEEFCLQGHLLARSFMHALDVRFGADVAVALGCKQLTGIAGLTARRLVRLVGPDVATVLRLHPALLPSPYVAFAFDGSVVTMRECDALREGDDFSWPALMARHDAPALDAIVREVDARARVVRIGERQWSITVDPDAPPRPEPTEVALASFSTGADFVFGTTSPRRA